MLNPPLTGESKNPATIPKTKNSEVSKKQVLFFKKIISFLK